jgi:hypothetical protein
MSRQHALETYRYRVDPDNVVVDVGGDWIKSVAEGAGSHQCLPEDVVGTPLRECIADEATWNLYGLLIDSVREKQEPVTIPIRCDAPEERRFCDLSISPAGGGHVDFESRLLRREPRESVPLLDEEQPRDDDQYVKVCSVCKRAEVAPGEWQELETAQHRLGLFDRERLPRVSHGLCADCFELGVENL